jgi:tetratricopeptide (TPR) repeat protein
MKTFSIVVLVVLMNVTTGFSQQTKTFTEAEYHFKQGKAFFDRGLFGQAQIELDEALNTADHLEEERSGLIKRESRFLYALAAIRQDLPDGERLILEFIRDYRPDPVATDAIVEVGNYYFNQKNYKESSKFYSMIRSNDVDNITFSEVKFKLGYGFFAQKNFGQAEKEFGSIRNIKNEYYYPSNYYYGMCKYFNKDYDAATASFDIALKSKAYRGLIPYYITQIYFSQGKYDEVIDYGKKSLSIPKVKNNGL